MEMLRTIIVALVFAGITVCTYYYLNSSQFPWESGSQEETVTQNSGNSAEKSLPAPALNNSESRTYAQDGPFSPAPAPAEEVDGFTLPSLEELPAAQEPSQDSIPTPSLTQNPPEGNPMVAATTPQIPAPPELDVPPVLDTDLPALNEMKTATPFEASPEAIQAQPETRIGSNAGIEPTQALPSPEPTAEELALPSPEPTAEELALPPSPPFETDPGTDLPVPTPIQGTPAIVIPTQPTGVSNSPVPTSATNQTVGGVVNPLRGNSPSVNSVPTSVPASAVPSMEAAPALTMDSAPASAVAMNSAPASAVAMNSAPAQTQVQAQSVSQESAETVAVREYLKKANEKIQNGEALEVLRELSKFYGNPRFSAEESSELVNILVQAATQVIYSQKSFLEPAYTLQAGDTLEKIAAEYQIPQDFIALVNGIQPGTPLQPGAQLKVIRGPFHAIVYLDRHEMLLTLNGLFAGRFWIGIGGELIQKDGDFSFVQKSVTQDGTSTMPSCDFSKLAGEPGCAEMMKIQACTDPNAIGSSAPSGSILMSQTDVQSLGAILGPKSQLIMRCHSPKPVVQQAASTPVQVPAAVSASVPSPGSTISASVPSPVPTISAPTPAVGSSAGLSDSLPDELPGTIPASAPAPAPVADELPLELPETL